MKQSHFTELLLTDLCSQSPYFRLLNQIRARRQSIHWQAQTQKSHPKKMYQELELLKTLEVALLDIQYTTPEKTKKVRRQFKKKGTREAHMRSIFGKCLMPSKNREVCPIEKKMLSNMAMANRDKRVSDLTTRILLEIIEKQSAGWYMVFNTLTVTDGYIKEVFKRESRVFEKYIGSVNYEMKKAYEKHNGKRKAATDNYHTYFAVVEEGGKTGRLHFHILHFIRYLPDYNDPNYGRKLPNRRVISSMRRHWTRGFSMPIAVRLDSEDNYARAGWRWPVKRTENGKVSMEAIETSNPLRMARYISKYIHKADQERAYRWRTRLSRGFGTTIIRKALRKLTQKQIEDQMMTLTMWKHLQVQDIAIPINITRKLAIREWLERQKKKKNNKNISTTQKYLTEVQARSSIVEQFRTLTKQRRRYNSQNISSIQTKSLKRRDIFDVQEVFSRELTRCGYNRRIQQGRGVTR